MLGCFLFGVGSKFACNKRFLKIGPTIKTNTIFKISPIINGTTHKVKAFIKDICCWKENQTVPNK